MSGRDEATTEPAGTQRLDKWLWFARVVKTRTLAAGLVDSGKVRVNRAPVSKPSHAVRLGDVVTVTAHHDVRVLKVLAPGSRRGSATEARALFEDLTPPRAPRADGSPDTTAPAPRPDKRQRRALLALKRG